MGFFEWVHFVGIAAPIDFRIFPDDWLGVWKKCQRLEEGRPMVIEGRISR